MSREEKRARKTKRGCLQAKQAGNASLPGLSPSRCSLAILPAHTRLNLTAPQSHSSPLAIRPSSLSFCVCLYYIPISSICLIIFLFFLFQYTLITFILHHLSLAPTSTLFLHSPIFLHRVTDARNNLSCQQIQQE